MGARADEGADLADFNALLEWVVQFIDDETRGAPFAIAGMSVGGQLARGVVERMPERVLGLLLRAPRLIASGPSGASMTRRARFRAIAISGTSSSTEITLVPGCPSASTSRTASVTLRGRRQRKRAKVDVLEQIETEGNYELDPLPLKVFERPSLIIVGRQDSRVGFLEALETGEEVRAEIGIAMHAQYPRATIVALDRAGHALPVGSTDLFHALVRDWLDRVEEVL